MLLQTASTPIIAAAQFAARLLVPTGDKADDKSEEVEKSSSKTQFIVQQFLNEFSTRRYE